MGAHILESHVSDQSTSHHGNNEVNDNDDSQPFEIPSKNNLSSSCFGDTFTTTTRPNLSKLTPPGNSIFVFKLKRKLSKIHHVIDK